MRQMSDLLTDVTYKATMDDGPSSTASMEWYEIYAAVILGKEMRERSFDPHVFDGLVS
jgi:hypothetical protein